MSSPRDEMIPTRASLLSRLKDWQDSTSWQDFFDTYWKLLYGVARKSGLEESEAQDVVQEVMIGVAKDMPDFKYDPSKCSFKSWLLIKARWKIVEQFRKRGRVAPPSLASPGTTDTMAQIPDPASLLPDAVWEAEWQENL